MVRVDDDGTDGAGSSEETQVDVNVQVDSRDETFEVFVDDRVRRREQRRNDHVSRQPGTSLPLMVSHRGENPEDGPPAAAASGASV